MGVLDSLLGSLGGGGQAANPQAAMISAIVGMLAGGGQQQGAGGGLGGMLGSALGGALGGGQPAGGGGLGGMLGSALGGALGGGQQQAQAVPGLGGLGGLLEAFTKGGMGDVAKSWIGTGQNLPVSADQLSNVLGADRIGALAGQLGMNQGDLLGQLSQMLPQVVDKLTPNGNIPQGDIGGVGDLAGMLGGLLKR